MAILCLVASVVGAQGPVPAQGPVAPLQAMEGAALGTFQDRTVVTSKTPFLYENDIAYAPGRTRIQYREYTIEADRIVVDFVTEDIMAEGNVLFVSPTDEIRAERGRFNLTTGDGVAYGVDGRSRDFFFRVHRDNDGNPLYDEKADGPAFRQINERESVFRGMHFTTSDFPVPFYYVTATEAIYLRKERVYLRNPVLWVRGVPVLWLPAYSRDLRTGSPWSMEFGYSSRLGAYLRLGYRYIHRVQTPSWENPEVLETRSHGAADFFVDAMGRRGEGVGVRYRYQFDFHRHIGYVEAYGLRDDRRDADDLNDSEAQELRWVYRHLHNSRLTDEVTFQLDIDRASDPDVHYDVLDRFVPQGADKRGRLFAQHMKAAMTYHRSDWIGRISAGQRERLTRNRYLDFTDPFDDDLDFDPDPDFLRSDRRDDVDGIAKSRYATVSEYARARYATRLLNIAGSPLWYSLEANAFSAMDASYNQFDTSDDQQVEGVDVYASLNYRMRLGERTTWLHTVGVGAAAYQRRSDSVVDRDDFFSAVPDADGVRRIDGQRFVDTRTILLGEGNRRLSMDDVDPYYMFAEYKGRINHRFSDSLDGYVKYRLREGTSDSLGEYYERAGRVEAFEDIYDFYTNHHDAEAGLNYYLRYPDLTSSVYAGENLQSRRDIFANEKLRYAGARVGYRTPAREFEATTGVEYQERQIRDRGDPNALEQGTINPYVRVAWLPRHGRWWAELTSTASIKTENDPVSRDNRQKRRFDEEDTEVVTSPIIGRQFGPKYKVQLGGQYNSRYDVWQSMGVTIIRDLHDAELGLFLGMRNNSFKDRRDDNDRSNSRTTDYEAEVRVSVRFKVAREQPGAGSRSIITLSDRAGEGTFVN